MNIQAMMQQARKLQKDLEKSFGDVPTEFSLKLP